MSILIIKTNNTEQNDRTIIIYYYEPNINLIRRYRFDEEKEEIKTNNIERVLKIISNILQLEEFLSNSIQLVYVDNIYIVNMFNYWVKDWIKNRFTIQFTNNYRPYVDSIINIYPYLKNDSYKFEYRNDPINILGDGSCNEKWKEWLIKEKIISS